MPTAPRLTTRQVDVRPDATPFQTGRGATQAAFGSGRGLQSIGQSLEQVAQTATRIGIENNEREAKQLDIEYTNQRRQLLYGDGTEENPGFYNLRGQNALDSAPVVRKQLEDLRSSLAASTDKASVKRMFELTSGVRVSQDLAKLDTFTAKERRTANDTTSEARVKEAIDDSVLAWNDEDTLTRSEVIIRNEVMDMGERNGWAPEVVQSKTEEARTLLYRDTVVAALKQKETAAARALFEKFKGKMDAPIAAEVQQMLEDGELIAEAQLETDTIMAATPDAETALKQARAITDPQLRDAVVTRVNQRISENERTERNAARDAKAAAYSAVFSGTNLDEWMTVNPEAARLVASDGTTMSGLMAAQNMVAEGNDFARRTDPDKFQEFFNMDVQDQASADLNEWRAHLTRSDWESLVRAQQGARSEVGDNAGHRATQSRAQSILRQVVGEDVWTGGETMNEEERARKNQLSGEMRSFIQGFIDRGDTPSENQIQAEAERLSIPVTVEAERAPGVIDDLLDALGIGNRDILAADINNLTPSEKANVRVDADDIPQSVRTSVENLFRKYNQTLTDDLLEQYVAAELTNDTTRKQRLLDPSRSPTVPLP